MSEPRGTVAKHPQRDEIEAALAAGMSDRKTAERFGLSKDAVRRHRLTMGARLERMIAAGKAEGAQSAQARVELLYQRANGLLDKAEAADKAAVSVALLRELRGLVELLAKLTGELDERPTFQVALVASPEWEATRAAMLQALTPFPDAALAVADRLRELEG